MPDESPGLKITLATENKSFLRWDRAGPESAIELPLPARPLEVHHRASMDYESGPEKKAGTIEGSYANYFRVGHNAFEFILDFGQLYSDAAQETVHTRIVTSPSYAKELLDVLRDAVAKYEGTFGPIRAPQLGLNDHQE